MRTLAITVQLNSGVTLILIQAQHAIRTLLLKDCVHRRDGLVISVAPLHDDVRASEVHVLVRGNG